MKGINFLIFGPGFWTFPAGSGEEISRRIRIWGQKIKIPASRGQKLTKTISENLFFNSFSFFFCLFLNWMSGLETFSSQRPWLWERLWSGPRIGAIRALALAAALTLEAALAVAEPWERL